MNAAAKRKVLVVEDNDLNLKLFRDLLEAHDFEVIDTRDGFIVPDLVEKEQPVLIVMDIQLPKISGIDIIRTLKGNKKLSSVPIVAVTAFAMKEDEDNILAAGCEAYLSKPISIEDFVETIQRFAD